MSKAQAVRGSIKDLEQRKKEVLKPILDNPFTQGFEWPTVDRSTSARVLEWLTQLLPQHGHFLKMKKSNAGNSDDNGISKITIGFNSTVKKLEEQAAPMRDRIMKRTSTKSPSLSYVKYVFVARNDIGNPHLTSCFPLLTFTASRSLENRVKLVELPRGSMSKLLSVLQIDNVGILSFEEDWASGKPLFDFVCENVKDTPVPWLEYIFDETKAQGNLFGGPRITFVRSEVTLNRKGKQRGGLNPKKIKTVSKVKRDISTDSGSKSDSPIV